MSPGDMPLSAWEALSAVAVAWALAGLIFLFVTRVVR